MPERCGWCDKSPLHQVEVARVGGDREYMVCEDCWPVDKWGEFPRPAQPTAADGGEGA